MHQHMDIGLLIMRIIFVAILFMQGIIVVDRYSDIGWLYQVHCTSTLSAAGPHPPLNRPAFCQPSRLCRSCRFCRPHPPCSQADLLPNTKGQPTCSAPHQQPCSPKTSAAPKRPYPSKFPLYPHPALCYNTPNQKIASRNRGGNNKGE